MIRCSSSRIRPPQISCPMANCSTPRAAAAAKQLTISRKCRRSLLLPLRSIWTRQKGDANNNNNNKISNFTTTKLFRTIRINKWTRPTRMAAVAISTILILIIISFSIIYPIVRKLTLIIIIIMATISLITITRTMTTVTSLIIIRIETYYLLTKRRTEFTNQLKPNNHNSYSRTKIQSIAKS